MDATTIQQAIADLTLSLDQLRHTRDELAAQIAQGLAKDGQSIKSLPSFMRRPAHDVHGEVVVLDAGGTNVRAAQVQLAGAQVTLTREPQADRTLMSEAQIVGAISRDTFFQRQAALIGHINSEREFNLGYCFSYPSTNTPDGDAALVNWTKGINIAQMMGVPLREQLAGALAAQGQIAHHTPVLNDTITTLIAAAWMAPDCDQYIGLIAGTGMNAAGFYRTRQISKLTPSKDWGADELMGVNLELGNFHPACLSAYDDALDAEALDDNPGKQRLEKAIAGKYTAEIFGRVVGREACLALPNGLAFDPHAGVHAGYVTQLREQAGLMGEAANALINRGADLTAAALAGVVQSQQLSEPCTVGILAEGTLFWQTNGYRERVEQTLKQLIPAHVQVRILQNTTGVDANFIGAACAALV
ncbi:MAG: hexokinase family protein [Formosimonas sp.]